MKQEYFTEEELEAFIQEVEADSKTAPFYLKEEIMKAAGVEYAEAAESPRRLPQQNVNQNRKLTARQRQQWLIYNCKIATAAAAAIALLFLFPAGQSTAPMPMEGKGMNVISDNISEKSQELCGMLSLFFDKFQ